MVEAKGQIIVVAVLLIGLSLLVSGQGIAPNGSPAISPPEQQQSKPARVHGSPKELSIKRRAKKQNQNQDQASVGNSKSGNTTANANTQSYANALRNYRHERHNRVWWRQHFTVFVLVGGGYYYWNGGYWCPAWGYDPTYESYDYDGPIYTYGNLLPDQVIVNVQRALKQLGYYAGGTTGSLGPATRQALANYQADAGLEVTGAIDAATVEALGLLG